ncbi:MAG: glycerol-3-phosphate 1-O-acyltransferase PlsY [Bacteroidales bacterium]|nr:glycerol-3-phosphate 1-O-acyltransferase PlsY [Bacteroidales bacterium]
MTPVNLSITLILSYMIGSVATAVWTGKIFHGIDVREHGSGNAGATNVIRVLGWKTGVPVLLLDVAKGWIASMLPVFAGFAEAGSAQLINFQILAGIAAITGHIFPLFAGFRGGKGVATIFGVLLAIHPFLTLSCLGVFLIVLVLSGYVSLSSMSAGAAFPLLLFLVFDTPSLFFRIFSIIAAIALIITHKKNIRRLISGEETRLFGKKPDV